VFLGATLRGTPLLAETTFLAAPLGSTFLLGGLSGDFGFGIFWGTEDGFRSFREGKNNPVANYDASLDKKYHSHYTL